MADDYETLDLHADGAILFVTINAPPMNLLGPELVRDLVSIIEILDRGEPYKVAVFRSADPDYFIAHVDVTKIAAYRQEAARLTGEASIALLFRRLAETKAVTIAQIEARARGAGNEFILNCDMRFAARGRAVFSQNEGAFGLVPGGGGAQHLVRMLGRGRAFEVMLSAEDYDAELAEHYGWINRSFEPAKLAPFVEALAARIATLPASGARAIKDRVNAISLASVEEFRRDSDLFGEGARTPEVQQRIRTAIERGFQSRDAEIDASRILGSLDN
ncbi:enoyl-CoA hydratase/isomerase family protein [Sphingomonas nostoxanthinifaciens]|uniref:enoyl-CoA hydratase/isomerase family protein n=1 Tax=Sphingomonas nostoxanthinifaciens TaxID=2872652 RepID=UPI001CC1FCAC|nr:enoyl-CoA hydratase/isomerase family protein [Sphingomonas nostoxanthinifaciens]UAK26270.1 enoyl-CoA hydratase/isomerase family protein [Sphingomonas nostoxanthinifaciens]